MNHISEIAKVVSEDVNESIADFSGRRVLSEDSKVEVSLGSLQAIRDMFMKTVSGLKKTVEYLQNAEEIDLRQLIAHIAAVLKTTAESHKHVSEYIDSKKGSKDTQTMPSLPGKNKKSLPGSAF